MDPVGAFLGWQLSRPISPQKKLNWAKRLKDWPYAAVRSAYGPVLCNAGNDRTYLKSIAGRYGCFIPDVLKRQTRPFTFFDIGANTGIFSLVAATLQRCTGIYAFEPNPDVFARLQRSIALNEANVTAFPLALTTGGAPLAELRVPAHHSGMGSLESGTGHRYLVATADRRFLDALSDRIDNSVIVKLDVEGHEIPVLHELFASRLGAIVSDVIVECAEEHQSDGVEPILERLRKAGFSQQGRADSLTYFDVHFSRTIK